MQANRRDLCGQRFGKLTVIRRVEGTQSNRARADSWLCRCDCGNESVVLGSNLVRGHTKSCGCIKLNDLTGQHIGSLTGTWPIGQVRDQREKACTPLGV